jgi:hypothetical protein
METTTVGRVGGKPRVVLNRAAEANSRGPAMLYEIVEAIAHPDHSVTITWSDGARGVVDFLPIIDRGGWFTPLRDGDYFAATMIVLEGGAGLTWPEEIDYASDALRRDAFPHGMPG